MVAHWSQIFPCRTEIPTTAVLIEPFSVAVHAVLKDPPPHEAKVLIIGSGSIGLFVLAALRLLGKSRCHYPRPAQETDRAGREVRRDPSAQEGGRGVLPAKSSEPSAID